MSASDASSAPPATQTQAGPHGDSLPGPGLVLSDDGRVRCSWAGGDLEYRRYHDEEWGVPLTDVRSLYEKLCLEGFQAGLSWITILRRRPAFREVFHNFEPAKVAAMTEDDVIRLLGDERIIRHRGKIEATINNAKVTLALDRPLSELIWSFAPEKRPRRAGLSGLPATTAESTALSKELRRSGFRFVGPTTMYALMQSAGLVDDHIEGCWRPVT
jgi:DNA-3-methyladenine glycosylase I